MTTVVDKLKSLKIEKLKKQKEDDIINKKHREEWSNKLSKLINYVRSTLKSLDYTEKDSQYGHVFDVKLGNRHVYIVCCIRYDNMRYSDDTPEVEVKSTAIEVGFLINKPEFIVGKEDFVSSFANFLETRNLV